MKNFPHQVTKLSKFREGLAVFSDLAEQGADLSDEGVVGDALARAGVHEFRGQPTDADIEDLLATEHSKPSRKQGSRTKARELRRTFEELNLLESSGSLGITEDATRLLAFEDGSQESQAMWRQAFRDVETADAAGTSHPYEIMLRLAGERPGIAKPLLGLALEARDDSEAEFARILRLVDENDVSPAWDVLGVSTAGRENSIKIFPSVAQQLGELVVVDGQAYRALPDPLEPREERRRRNKRAVRSRRRRYDGNRKRGKRPTRSQPTIRSYDPDLSAARYEAHEACLSTFDAAFDASFDRWEGDYDLVVVGADTLLLVEVKTIRSDADNQVRLGLGQLLYYEHFDVRPDWPSSHVGRLLVTDSEIDEELKAFLDAHEVGLVEGRSDGSWNASTRAQQLLTDFDVSL
jgi:hypothetical protein